MTSFARAITLLLLLVATSSCGGGSAPTAPDAPTTTTRVIGLSGTLAFGNVEIGQSASRTLTITNTGDSTLTVSGLTVSTGSACRASWTGGTIAAGSSQAVTITFTPTATQTYSGVLTVTGDQTSGTNTISISGTGIPAGTTTPTATRIIALSGDLAFGNVQVGQRASATLTITNSGNSVLTVTGTSYPPGFTGNFADGTIAAGGTRAVTVTFIPIAAQVYGGTLTVNGDQTSGTNTIAVSGTGTAPTGPTITLTSASVVSVSAAAQTITVTWTLTNADASHRTLLRALSTMNDRWLTLDCNQPGDEDTTNGRADLNECWFGASGNGSFSRTVRVVSNGNNNYVRTGSLTLFDAFNNSITVSVTQGTTSPIVTLLSPSAYDLTAAAQTITISWRLTGADPAHRMFLETPPRILFDVWAAQTCNQPGDESFSLGSGPIGCWLGPAGDGTYSRTILISTLSTSSNRYGTISLKDAFGNQFNITVHQAVSSPNCTATLTSAGAAGGEDDSHCSPVATFQSSSSRRPVTRTNARSNIHRSRDTAAYTDPAPSA